MYSALREKTRQYFENSHVLNERLEAADADVRITELERYRRVPDRPAGDRKSASAVRAQAVS